MPPETSLAPCSASVAASTWAFSMVRRWSSRNSGSRASLKATALAAMTCISGPALDAREDRLVHGRAQVGARERDAAARPAQGLVGGGRDQVRVRERAGMEAGRDQARDVGHVHEQQRVDAVGDGRHALEVDDPGVGAGARDDHPSAGPPAAWRSRAS